MASGIQFSNRGVFVSNGCASVLAISRPSESDQWKHAFDHVHLPTWPRSGILSIATPVKEEAALPNAPPALRATSSHRHNGSTSRSERAERSANRSKWCRGDAGGDAFADGTFVSKLRSGGGGVSSALRGRSPPADGTGRRPSSNPPGRTDVPKFQRGSQSRTNSTGPPRPGIAGKVWQQPGTLRDLRRWDGRAASACSCGRNRRRPTDTGLRPQHPLRHS